MLELNHKHMLDMRYRETAERCRILLGGFAKIGIIALVDEATGYQYSRKKDALQQILDRYLYEKHATWAKRFPDEFYRQIFRLRGWEYAPQTIKRPGVIGTITKDVVYKRLAPGILEELEHRNPPVSPGVRKVRHHQFLTDDIGHPTLRDHISGVIAIMRISDNWPDFRHKIIKAYPIVGEQHLLDLYRDIPEDEIDD
ncbi:P63C domain-containing protein [Alkalispirochaeta americana]|uniref:p63C domain-containing protein n=1 Tax=Alkalispirochaeta americana TaxID=159291 RepID=A0A1N6XE51_9SPIO|nr:P63C domain-containing protein [Alkalispirochaeta americana]